MSTLPCEGPTGLAIDVKGKKLFSVCDNVMAVTDIPTFKVVGTAAIGLHPMLPVSMPHWDWPSVRTAIAVP